MSDLNINVKNDALLGKTTESRLHIELIKKDNLISLLLSRIAKLEYEVEEKDKEIEKLKEEKKSG